MLFLLNILKTGTGFQNILNVQSLGSHPILAGVDCGFESHPNLDLLCAAFCWLALDHEYHHYPDCCSESTS